MFITVHVTIYDHMIEVGRSVAFSTWVLHVVFFTFLSTTVCLVISKQAVGSFPPMLFLQPLPGSGIPEVNSIMHGFKMPNYLTFRTLIAKMIGLTLAMGAGLPIGKEVSSYI